MVITQSAHEAGNVIMTSLLFHCDTDILIRGVLVLFYPLQIDPLHHNQRTEVAIEQAIQMTQTSENMKVDVHTAVYTCIFIHVPQVVQ